MKGSRNNKNKTKKKKTCLKHKQVFVIYDVIKEPTMADRCVYKAKASQYKENFFVIC